VRESGICLIFVSERMLLKMAWAIKQKNIWVDYLNMFQVEGVLLSLKQYGAEHSTL
jgi:hypothetical protein